MPIAMRKCEVVNTVRFAKGSDGGIALDLQRGQMFGLNPLGALILESLRAGKSETEIVAEIVITYGIDAETATCDFAEFLNELQTHQIVQLRTTEACR